MNSVYYFQTRNKISVRIRPAESRDKEAVIELVREVLGEYGLALDLNHWDSDLLKLEIVYGQKNSHFYVAEAMNPKPKIIGTIGFDGRDFPLAEITKLFIQKEFRNQGLGQKLLDLAVELGKEVKFKSLRLETSSLFKEAGNLYLKNGFLKSKSALKSPCDEIYSISL